MALIQISNLQPLKQKMISLGLCLLGLSLLIKGGLGIIPDTWYPTNVEIAETTLAVSPTQISRPAKPNQLTINTLNIDLPIHSATIVDGEWQVSNTGLSHLATSAHPSEGGNIVLYGHNWWGYLYTLNQIQVGNIIQITSADGIDYSYEVEAVRWVTPDQTQYIQPTNSEQLTLYTCAGFWDEQRLIVQAKPLITTLLAQQ